MKAITTSTLHYHRQWGEGGSDIFPQILAFLENTWWRVYLPQPLFPVHLVVVYKIYFWINNCRLIMWISCVSFKEFTLVASAPWHILHKHTNSFSQGDFLIVLITLLTAWCSASWPRLEQTSKAQKAALLASNWSSINFLACKLSRYPTCSHCNRNSKAPWQEWNQWNFIIQLVSLISKNTTSKILLYQSKATILGYW